MKFLELKIPPVAQVLATGAAMYGVSKTLPMLQTVIPGAKWLAGGLTLTGIGIGIVGVNEFKKAQTTVNPHKPNNATNLVTGSIYQYTRNPMYLGLTLVLLAWALYLAHLLAFFVILIFVLYMTRFQIIPEERVMQQKFGKAYQAYLKKVRRWI